MNVVILGGDITALVAAHAVKSNRPDARIIVLSPSTAGPGPALLMPPMANELMPLILDVCEPHEIVLRSSGAGSDWSDKVGRPDKTPERFPYAGTEMFRALVAGELWDALTELYAGYMAGFYVAETTLEAILHDYPADVLINTAPRPLWCSKPDEHGFARRDFWVSSAIGPTIADDTILVNAEDSPAWYVTSKIGGHQVTKWLVRPPFSNVLSDSQPMSTNCDCAPHGMVHLGVEAQCNPIVTLADVYSDAVDAILSREKV